MHCVTVTSHYLICEVGVFKLKGVKLLINDPKCLSSDDVALAVIILKIILNKLDFYKRYQDR